METTINLQSVQPARVPGYPTNFVGEGWLERVKGQLLRNRNLRASVAMDDDLARKAMDFMTENPGHAFPFSFTDANRIVGVELLEGEGVPV